MASISISIDVPNLAEGIRFYTSALGFAPLAEPYPGVAVLGGHSIELCLLERPAGSSPATGAKETRHYARHWTPVHLDIHVENLKLALAQAIGAGAKQEHLFETEHGSAAFCSDPFGHGFCLLERKPSS